MQNNINIDEEVDLKSKKIQFFIKRIIDIFLSIIGIIILLPVFIVIIIAIKIDTKGSSIFKQIRVGKEGKNFVIYKFRTMVVDAENKSKLEINPDELENFVFQNKSDDRVTKVGAFLRRTSLDELPQLFNVFLGTMSFVGPRPEIPEVVQYYSEYYRKRLLVTPGITGLAQINGRGEIELGKTIYYDLTYIKNFSIGYDFQILIKTFFSVIKHEGAY